MASENPLHLGLLADGDRRWIAGVNYINNLMRALATENSSTLSISLLRYVGSDPALYSRLGEVFSFRRTDSNRRKCVSLYFSLRSRSFTSLEDLVERKRIDVVFPSLRSLGSDFPVPWLGWIPDFQHKCMPELFSAREHHLRDESCRILLSDATAVVVSSRTAAGHLNRWFNPNGKKVIVLPFVSNPDPSWFTNSPEILKRYRLPERFLFFPSQFWVHKNHLTLFQAMAILKSQGHRDVTLVCTGVEHDYRNPDHCRRLSAWKYEQALGGQIRCLGLLPRDDQMQLMRRSVAVVQPSLFEGWSYLVEDARSLGKPIVLSDLPVHREQDPPEAYYFNPRDPEMLASQLLMAWNRFAGGIATEREQAAQELEEIRRREFRRRVLEGIRVAIVLKEGVKQHVS